MLQLSISFCTVVENISLRTWRSEDRNLPSDGGDTIQIYRHDHDFLLKTKLGQNASPWIRHERMAVGMVTEIEIAGRTDPHHEELVVDCARPEQQFPMRRSGRHIERAGHNADEGSLFLEQLPVALESDVKADAQAEEAKFGLKHGHSVPWRQRI